MPNKRNRYAAINAAKNGDWDLITSESLVDISLKALRRLEAAARRDNRGESARILIQREIQHAAHDSENQQP
jgi:hypothetical protein